jgi:GWxTD domain-containing protein
MRKIHWLVAAVAAIFTLLLPGCSSTEKSANKPVAVNPYSAGDLDVDATFTVFHLHSDSSRLFIRLNTKNLLYNRAGTEEFSAKVQVKISPAATNQGANFSPELKTIQATDYDNEKLPKTIVLSTTIKLPAGNDYKLNIEIIDANRKRSTNKMYIVEKSSPHKRQNFIAAYDDLRNPFFNDRITAGSRVILGTNAAPDGKVYVSYFKRTFALPPPPFVLYEQKPFDYQPDFRFTLDLDENNHCSFMTEKEGFYHVQNDTLQQEGYTLFVSEPEFPAVTTVQNMLEPFRFLVSSKEFKSVSEATDVKLALEKQWIEWSGDKERARKSIKLFYSRVEDANIYFSSHTDGWKSDRGLIFVIYGKPNKVYRTTISESWIYGEENNPLSITFNFVKVINPFTVNDYRLTREDYYRPSWYRAIEAWRNGRVL